MRLLRRSRTAVMAAPLLSFFFRRSDANLSSLASARQTAPSGKTDRHERIVTDVSTLAIAC